MVYEIDKHVYNFQQYQTKRSFAKNTFSGKISLDNGDKDRRDLLKGLIGFNKRSKLRSMEKK